jgi:hypothetical protein
VDALYLGFGVAVGVVPGMNRRRASANAKLCAEVQTGTKKISDTRTGSHITVDPVNRFTRHTIAGSVPALNS